MNSSSKDDASIKLKPLETLPELDTTPDTKVLCSSVTCNVKLFIDFTCFACAVTKGMFESSNCGYFHFTQ